MTKSPYEGGKPRRHFTLSDHAYQHLTDIARGAGLSRSETIERLIRSTAFWQGEAMLSEEAWKYVRDQSVEPSH
jgi:hypothetical protein